MGVVDFIELLVAFCAIAVCMAFAIGRVVAPDIVLARGTCRWRRRLTWMAVALATSRFGLRLFPTGEARRNPDGRRLHAA